MSIKTVAKTDAFTAIEVGPMAGLNGFEHGKVFLKDATNATGAEISLTTYAPGQAGPFFHSHKKHEETYITIRGNGEMQLDDQIIQLKEGSVVRVGPKPSRNIKNTGLEQLVVACIQTQEGSLIGGPMEDANLLETAAKFTK